MSESQTAQEFIQSQLELEQEARDALPYQFDTCTRELGPLRQNLFSCLTCNPPPSDTSNPYTPAGVCYACSISCHGEHELVELFSRRNFECDCGTLKLPPTSPCSLRLNAETGSKGGVHSEQPCRTNAYNRNFRNRFCGCGELYNPHTEKGTMFQCIGLASEEDGGCGEDWWHPECLMGLPRAPVSKVEAGAVDANGANGQEVVKAEKEQPTEAAEEPNPEDDETPLPAGFPKEDDFEHLVCYKCVEKHPWIKVYAGTPGFLPGLPYNPAHVAPDSSKKRKAEDDNDVPAPKKLKSDPEPIAQNDNKDDANSASTVPCKLPTTSTPPETPISLFLKEDFRDHLCRCPTHFPLLTPHPALLEAEDVYEPPVSEGSSAGDGPSEGSRSLYDRGEAALSNVDRVRAIEGVMAYNNLRDKVKDFLKPFAESGTPVSADAIKEYFERLRGDDQAAREQRGQRVENGAEK